MAVADVMFPQIQDILRQITTTKNKETFDYCGKIIRWSTITRWSNPHPDEDPTSKVSWWKLL